MNNLISCKLIIEFDDNFTKNIIPNILNEENIYIVIQEIVNNKDFGKSVIEIEILKVQNFLRIMKITV